MAETDTSQLSKKQVLLLLGTLVVSAMVMILNETTLSVALPAIMEDFNVTADVVQWLITGFMLTMAIVSPTTGFLIQRFTTRSIFLFAMVLFIIGSVLGVVAPAFWVLLLARVIQAIGTALITPLLMTVTLTVIAPERRGAVMGLNSVVISVAPALGPTLAGFVLTSFTWHHLFWVMVPIALIALVVGFLGLPNVGENRSIPFDTLSVILSVFAFGGLVYGLSTISALLSGTSRAPIVAFAVGIVFLAVFVWRQMTLGRQDRALLDLSAFGHKNFTFSVITVFMAMAMMLGTVNVMPIYLQVSLAVTAMVTGLVMLPGGLLQGVASPIIGRIYDSVGPRPLAVPGAILMMGSQWWLSFVVTDNPSVGLIVAIILVFNLGMALVMTPLMTVSLSSLPMNLYGHGSAIMNTLQQLGGAAGTAVLIASMTIGAQLADEAGAGAAAAQADGAATAFISGGVLGIIAVIASVFVGPLNRAPKVVDESDPTARDHSETADTKAAVN